MPHAAALASILSLHLSDPTTARARTRDSLGGSYVKALTAFLSDYADGACVVCRNPFTADDPAVAGHIIPATILDKGGYVPGNLAAMHKTCNAVAGDFPFHTHLNLLNTDGIPTEWAFSTKRTKMADPHKSAREGYGFPF